MRLALRRPVWGESGTLEVTSQCAGSISAGSGELTQILHIVVYDHNNFLPDDVIGEITLGLALALAPTLSLTALNLPNPNPPNPKLSLNPNHQAR